MEQTSGRIDTVLSSSCGVEGAVRGLEGTHLADSCILTELE
jgi:hypothetical protein